MASALLTAQPTVIAPPPIAREFRAAWSTPVTGPDWPSRPGLSADAQRAELRELLDRAHDIGLNAVILHVRTAADAIYPTAHAPWSYYLSGQVGRAPEPFYDPLEFAIREAHARGMELHAWFNPFRAAPPDRPVTPSADHVIVKHREWIVKYGSQTWIDPGLPEARQDVLNAILDVVDRYDVDGIHIDDYFYPYLENGAAPFADTASWRRFGQNAGFASRADWRRANINGFVESLYHAVKQKKPWVSVGVSPFGIWRPNHPKGVTGLNAYTEIFADARLWLREGWVDYMAPQLYWPLDGAQNRFTKLNIWWHEQNVMNRHIWPGLYTDLESRRKSNWPSGEIARQIWTLRGTATPSAGHVHFQLHSLTRQPHSLGDTYADPALTPAMPWLDARVPDVPRVHFDNNGMLRVNARQTVPVRWLAVQTLERGRWRLEVYPFKTLLPVGGNAEAVAVTAVSRTGITSAPAILAL